MKIFFFLIVSSISICLLTLYLIPFKKKKIFLFFIFFLTTLTISIYLLKSDLNIINYQERVVADLKESEKIDPIKLISFLEYKLSKEPNDLEGWLILSRTCLISGYIQKANLYYSRSIDYFPEDLNLLKEVAEFKIKNSQANEALNILLKIKELEPNNPNNIIMLISTYISLKDFNKAKKEFKELNKQEIDLKTLDGIKMMLENN